MLDKSKVSQDMTIVNNIPYILFETPGWSEEHDLDDDGILETVANIGTTTWPDYLIYS